MSSRKLADEMAEIKRRLGLLETGLKSSATNHSPNEAWKQPRSGMTPSNTNNPTIAKLDAMQDQILEFLHQSGPLTVSPEIRELWNQLNDTGKLAAFALALGAAKLDRDRRRFVSGTSTIEPDPEAYATIIYRSLFPEEKEAATAS
jgi:hypothetical protein